MSVTNDNTNLLVAEDAQLAGGAAVPEGCVCIAHSVYAVGEDDETTFRVPIPAAQLKFTPHPMIENSPGSGSFSTLAPPSSPLLWNGKDLIIPKSGIYYTEISFVRDIQGSTDDVFLQLWRDPRNSPPQSQHQLGSAWAGESTGSSNERQTGHFSILTLLEAGDRLFVKAIVDGDRPTRISNTRWNTFSLCCDPSLAVPCPC